MRTGIIYKYQNKESGKCYVGQTINPQKRYIEHLNTKKERDWHLDYQKNPDKYEYSVLEENIIQDKLDEREIYWIAYFDSFKNGYNKTAGGNSNRIVSNESRQKISEAKKGKPSPRKGAVLSNETKQKISESRKGLKLSEDTKKILSEQSKGRHWFNNGVNNVFVRECPEGYVKGKLIKNKSI